jgi:DNA-binding response OmpR family regulator
MFTDNPGGPEAVVPALQRLDHDVTAVPYTLIEKAPAVDCVLLDGTADLIPMVAVCRSDALRGLATPVIVVAPLHALAVLRVSWGFDDWLLPDCSRNELQTRLRLSREVWSEATGPQPVAGLALDPETFAVTVHGQHLNLTFTEFELLRALVSAPKQVWSRAALLRDVWGHQRQSDTRTVDVHIRRLRAKLGPEIAACIQTVRKVGYRFVPDTSPAPVPAPLGRSACRTAPPYAVREAS